MRKINRFLTVLAVSAASFSTQAALYNRGEGLIYDDVLNLTWLQDANYAKTSGFDINGRMDWESAVDWADKLVYSGYSDWRLPTLTPVNGSNFQYDYSYNGTTDSSYSITSQKSELAYMFYVNLNNPSRYLANNDQWPNGEINPNWTGHVSAVFQDAAHGNVNDSFVNLQSDTYWTGLEYAPDLTTAWVLSAWDGFQDINLKFYSVYAWAVRSGDVFPTGNNPSNPATVPVPGAVWFFVSGLMGLLGIRRFKNIG